jgi:hypothetical protein
MNQTKTEVVRLSAESVTLIEEIWELAGNLSGKNPSAEQMRAYVQGKDEYQLRKLALQLRDQWRGGSKKETVQEEANVREGGEGTSL